MATPQKKKLIGMRIAWSSI